MQEESDFGFVCEKGIFFTWIKHSNEKWSQARYIGNSSLATVIRILSMHICACGPFIKRVFQLFLGWYDRVHVQYWILAFSIYATAAEWGRKRAIFQVEFRRRKPNRQKTDEVSIQASPFFLSLSLSFSELASASFLTHSLTHSVTCSTVRRSPLQQLVDWKERSRMEGWMDGSDRRAGKEQP